MLSPNMMSSTIDFDTFFNLPPDAMDEQSITQARLPSPPLSDLGSPTPMGPTLSMSTTFQSSQVAGYHDTRSPDMALVTTDSVLFYVHHSHISRSVNDFKGLLSHLNPPPSATNPPTIAINAESNVLNVFLHTIYGLSCVRFSPSFAFLQAAVDMMPVYGFDPATFITSSTPLFTLLLSAAPLQPLPTYILAAKHNLNDLAVTVSSHLLSYNLSSLTDQQALEMGPVYLKKLFFLHLGRCDALRRHVIAPPKSHPATTTCGFVSQKQLATAWSLSAAYFAWEAKPDISATVLESTMNTLGTHLKCPDCKHALQQRIRDLVVQWSLVKRTI